MKRLILTTLVILLLTGVSQATWPVYSVYDSITLVGVDSTEDDTSQAYGTKLPWAPNERFTKMDYHWKFLSLASTGEDTIAGYIIIQLKNMGLRDSTNKDWSSAGAGSYWYEYDSSAAVASLVDSAQYFRWGEANSVLSQTLPLPWCDSLRFIWRSGATNDSLNYWKIAARFSGNSGNPQDAIYGRYTNLGLAAAADDTTDEISLMIPYDMAGQTYRHCAFWYYVLVDTAAAADDLDGDFFFEILLDSLSQGVHFVGEWLPNAYGGVKTWAYNVKDSLCIVSHFEIPGTADKLRIRNTTDATSDSCYWIDFWWMLTK